MAAAPPGPAAFPYVYRADRVRLAHEVATIPEKYRDAVG
jgi:hypothetical protein